MQAILEGLTFGLQIVGGFLVSSSFPYISCYSRLKDLCNILCLYLVAEITLEDGTLERPSNDVTFKISNLKFQVSIHKYMSSLSDLFKRTPVRFLGRFTFGHHKSYAMSPKL